jgi:uncharacterized protein (TIGR03086 family)
MTLDTRLGRALELDEAAIERTGAVVAQIEPDHLDRPTPCDGWDVRALLDHVVGGNLLYAAAAAGEQPDWSTRSDDHLGADHRSAYRRSAQLATKAFDAAARDGIPLALPFGVYPAARAIPIHFVDVLVHGWDLAAAAGLERRLDDDLARAALEIVASYPAEAWGDPRFFANRLAAPTGASLTDELVATLGRLPAWEPPA